MKKVLPHKGVPETVAAILQDRVYMEHPVSRLSKKYGLPVEKIREVLESPANREYTAYLRREKKTLIRGRYNSLAKASYRAMKQILETNHVVDVIDERSGEVVGHRIDPNIMKIKEKVASDVLQNVGAKKGAGKGPMFQINNVNSRERDARILEDNRKKEIENLLDKCKVIEAKPA